MTEDIPELVRTASRHVRSRYFDSAGWDEFKQRSDDIIISTYPKCGTTWTQRIVGMLIFQSAAPFPVQDSSPWPDFLLIPLDVTFQKAEAQTHRRFIKSHLPYDALPVHAGVKFIHVARDGRDAAMSFFNHKLNYTAEVLEQMDQLSLNDSKFGDRNPDIPKDPAQHFHDWVGGYEDDMGDPGASFFHLEKSFWEARHQPEVLLVHFNDLKADLGGEMRRIADFLDITVPENHWSELVKAAGFDSMKRNADALMPTAGNIWKGGGQTFLNKGTNGRWRDVYAQEDLDSYDAKVAKEFSPSLANWVEHGRLTAGDPQDAPD
jgi:aryl sulfotransferase